MSEALTQTFPAWQTEELQDEWVEPDEEDNSDHDDTNISYGTRSISLTTPLAAHIHVNGSDTDGSPSNTPYPVGTFLVREDIPSAPLLPKTPGRHNKGLVKDFFSPLPLERMFEPPSPPYTAPGSLLPPNTAHVPSRLSQSHANLEEEETDLTEERKASIACEFTFAVPKDNFLHPDSAKGDGYPQAESTPTPPFVPSGAAPATDPRLRLFQFQYDTYTRDHLSAMVDSIAINTPSGTGSTPSPTSFDQGLSRVSEVPSSIANMSHLRSTKRVKLSPRSDYYGEGAGAGASITRPKIFGKDYVGESQSLMQQIKQARDFSTISTVASGQQDNSPQSGTDRESFQRAFSKQTTVVASTRRPSFLSVAEKPSRQPSSSEGTMTSKAGSYSSSAYRQQAATLMEQIKSDMKGQKRVLSGETDASYSSTHLGDKTRLSERSPSPDTISIHIPPSSSEETDTRPQQNSSHRRTSSTRSQTSERLRDKHSPRKLLRRLSAADEADRELADEVSNMNIGNRRPSLDASASRRPSATSSNANTIRSQPNSQHLAPSSLAPPSYPSSSIRVGTNDDLNRFVSSSTASGTTITAGSVPSFTKHAGPVQIRTIAPTDLPPLPERLGDMLFDKVMMKWVKSTAQATRTGDGMGSFPTEEASEDPFGDIESLRDDSRGRDADFSQEEDEEEAIMDPPQALVEMSRIEEQSELDDEEEMELTSFSTDASARVVDVMTGVDTDGMEDDQTTDSEDNDELDHNAAEADVHEADFDSDDASHQEAPSYLQQSSPSRQLAPVRTNAPTFSTPHRTSSAPSATPAIRSVLKSHSATPNSVLKDSSQRQHHKRGHRRSVSFSDGKRDGPIQGLSMTTTEGEEADVGESAYLGDGSTGGDIVQSARSKRIADMMGALEHSDADESPSKASGSRQPSELQPLSVRKPHGVADESKGHTPRRVFSRSQAKRAVSIEPSHSKGNATFLTECSFAVSHDRLVEVITDVQPFEPYWEELNSIDLSNKRLESVARLKEFLPRLDALSLNSNQLAWLSGIPGSVRTLSVASNSLTGITSYSHLLNLENLDISRNGVDSLQQLACLRHLRELKADGNKINSIDGLQRMDGLVKLSLQGNCIQSVQLEEYRWTRLEMLNLSHNRVESVHGLETLPSLIALNIDSNLLGTLELEGPVPKLRILRVSGNRLQELDVGGMVNLRTLYADNNSLSGLVRVDRLTKLENLSVRNQSGRGLKLLTRDIRDVKRLYLSGNALKKGFLNERCYNLVYLELAACRLTALPEEMSSLVPNVRVLNLNYNFLEDARPLEGLTRMKKLTMIGSRLKGTKPLIRLLQRMPDVEMLDFRMNPCTLGWYLPLLVRDVPGALQPSEGGGGKTAAGGWQELDSKFRRDLPDEGYLGRLAYRGLIMRGCTRIRMLDGVEVTEKERAKAGDLLEGILGKGRRDRT